MAAYTPVVIVTPTALGNGAANIATWRYRSTGGVSIVRTTVFNTPTAARTVTLEHGSVAADTTAQKILDAYPLTASVPYRENGWIVLALNDYYEAFANAADINGAAYGYTYV